MEYLKTLEKEKCSSSYIRNESFKRLTLE